MADEPVSILLEYMRRFDAKLDHVITDLHDLKARVTSVGEGLAGVHRRMDRFEPRLDRIETRLRTEGLSCPS